MYKLNLDYSCETDFDTFYKFLKQNNGKLTYFNEIGPAGGNPNFECTFEQYENALNFIQSFYQNLYNVFRIEKI